MISPSELHAYVLSRFGAVEEFPFGPDVRVFKVMGKMFALIPVDEHDNTISLKCDPVLAQLQRQTYTAVQPGYHLNKQHWNTVTVDGTIPDVEIFEMIDHSYELVVRSLKKSEREELTRLKEQHNRGADS